MDANRNGSSRCDGLQCKSAAGYLLAVGIGLGVGAGAMFLYDPNRGKARRHQLRDQARSAIRTTAETVSKSVEDVGNRAKGAALGARNKLAGCTTDVPDAKLAGRIRAKLGHLSREAGKVRIDVRSGTVAIYGHVDEPGFEKVVSELAAIPGVVSIDDYTYSTSQKSRSLPLLAKMVVIPTVLGLGGILASVKALSK